MPALAKRSKLKAPRNRALIQIVPFQATLGSVSSPQFTVLPSNKTCLKDAELWPPAVPYKEALYSLTENAISDGSVQSLGPDLRTRGGGAQNRGLDQPRLDSPPYTGHYSCVSLQMT